MLYIYETNKAGKVIVLLIRNKLIINYLPITVLYSMWKRKCNPIIIIISILNMYIKISVKNMQNYY